MNTYSQERLRELLLEIDEEVELEVGLGKRHSVVIVGGAAFMLATVKVYEREYKPKATKLTKRSVSKRGRKS